MNRKLLLHTVPLVIALAAIATNARAANKTWTNGSTDFLWNTTSANWSPSNWANGDEGIFGATGVGTITVDAGGVTATNMTFNTAGYTIGGGTITLDTGSTTQIFANEDVTISSALSKSGGGYFLGNAATGKTLTLNGNLNNTAAVNEMYFQGNGSVAINGSIGSGYTNFKLNSGSTTVTFATANSFTGVLQLVGTNNTLNFSDVNQLGTGTGGNYLAVQNGATLRYTGTGAQATANRDVYWNTAGGGKFDIVSSTGDLKLNITGGVHNGGPLLKTGLGTLALASAGVNVTTAAVAINQGTLALQANGSNFVVFGSTVSGASGTLIKVLSGTGAAGNANFTANWAANLADMDIAANGKFGLRGNNITIDALTGGGELYHGYNFGAGAGTRTVSLGVDNGSGAFTGIIHGNGTSGTLDTLENGVVAVTKLGTGTQTLSGINTYAGGTTITGGTLLANTAVAGADSATGTGVVTVGASGTLGGIGQIRPTGTNAITVNGTLAPGASIGTLTIDSAGSTAASIVTMANNSLFRYELGAAGASLASPGTSDLLVINGASLGDFDFAPLGNTVNFLGTGAAGYYKLFDTSLANAGVLTDTWDNLTYDPVTGLVFGGLLAANLAPLKTGIFYVGTGGGPGNGGDLGDIYLQVVAVPEPGSFAMLLFGGVMMWLLRRNR